MTTTMDDTSTSTILINRMDGDNVLHWAIRNGNLQEIIDAITQHPETAQQKNMNDEYPLHLACYNLQSDEDSDRIICKLLQLYPMAAEEKDNAGNLPLHIALMPCPLTEYVIQLLLSAYPLAVECMNYEMMFPLHHACQSCMTESIVLQLLDMYPTAAQCKCCLQRYPLHIACHLRYSVYDDKEKSEKIVTKLLETYPEAAEGMDELDNQPLHLALKKDQSEYVIQLLISVCPSAVEFMNQCNEYPLHLACKGCHSETIVLQILDMFPIAAQYLECIVQSYPLHCACSSKYFSQKVVMQLLDIYPEAAKCADKYGNFPIHLACDKCNEQSEKVLLRLINIFPESLNIKNFYGMYPLHLACKNCHNLSMKCVHMLTNMFPTAVQTQDCFGNFPLHYSFVLNNLCLPPLHDLHIECDWIRKRLNTIVLHLIDAYPSAAMHRNQDTLYPIHLACEQDYYDKVILCLIDSNTVACTHATHRNVTISSALEDLRNRDDDDLRKGVDIPTIVTSHNIKNLYRCSIMHWVQCNTPSYSQGKYTQESTLIKSTTCSKCKLEITNYRKNSSVLSDLL